MFVKIKPMSAFVAGFMTSAFAFTTTASLNVAKEYNPTCEALAK